MNLVLFATFVTKRPRASTNLLNSYVLQSNCQLSTLNCQLSTAITPSTLVVVGCVAAGNFPLRRRYSRATHPTFLTPSAAERATPTRLTRIPAATKTRLPLVSILTRRRRSPQIAAAVTRTGRSISIWRCWIPQRYVRGGRSQAAGRP